MSAGDYIVLALVAVLVAAAVIYMLRRRKKGRCIGCCGDCSSCVYNKNK